MSYIHYVQVTVGKLSKSFVYAPKEIYERLKKVLRAPRHSKSWKIHIRPLRYDLIDRPGVNWNLFYGIVLGLNKTTSLIKGCW